MKLIKFLNCDAPLVPPGAVRLSPERRRLTVTGAGRAGGGERERERARGESEREGAGGARGGRAGGTGGERARGGGEGAGAGGRWRLLPADPSAGACYWLLADDDTPIGPVAEVLLAAPEESGLAPRGVDEAHVENVDLRSKMNRHMQRSREEYGQTFKTAAKSAALLMDAERLKVDRDAKTKRERERVVEAVENGELMNHQTRARVEESGDGESKKKKSTSRRH